MSDGILVLCEHDGGVFKKTAHELLGKATELSAAVGGPVIALVIGHDGGAELGGYGAQKVLTVSGEAFSTTNTGPRARAIRAAIERVRPGVLLAAAGPQTREALPRVAAAMGLGMATEVTDLRADGGQVVGRRPVYSGKALADVRISSATAIFTVRPNSFPVTDGGSDSAAVEALSVALTDGDLAAKVVSVEAAQSTVVDLTEADRIVSGGRSVKSKDGFDNLIRPLAASIGATPGASRAAVDAGYTTHSTQVGQTGKVVNPSLYIACGISGAIQHLAGMRTSRVIVAINTDPEAPIFQHATYGIVGDMFEVGPKLAAAFEKALS